MYTYCYEAAEFLACFNFGLKQAHRLTLVFAKASTLDLKTFTFLSFELLENHVYQLLDRYYWVLFAQPFQLIVEVSFNKHK